MINKKILLFLAIIAIIFSLAYFLRYYPSLEILLKIVPLFRPKVKPAETRKLDIALTDLMKTKEKLIFDIKENNTCYWIRPGRDENGYYLEIKEYQNSGKIKGCFGPVKNTKYIPVDHPTNIHGIDCICDGKIHQFDWKSDGLKISKR